MTNSLVKSAAKIGAFTAAALSLCACVSIRPSITVAPPSPEALARASAAADAQAHAYVKQSEIKARTEAAARLAYLICNDPIHAKPHICTVLKNHFYDTYDANYSGDNASLAPTSLEIKSLLDARAEENAQKEAILARLRAQMAEANQSIAGLKLDATPPQPKYGGFAPFTFDYKQPMPRDLNAPVFRVDPDAFWGNSPITVVPPGPVTQGKARLGEAGTAPSGASTSPTQKAKAPETPHAKTLVSPNGVTILDVGHAPLGYGWTQEFPDNFLSPSNGPFNPSYQAPTIHVGPMKFEQAAANNNSDHLSFLAAPKADPEFDALVQHSFDNSNGSPPKKPRNVLAEVTNGKGTLGLNPWAVALAGFTTAAYGVAIGAKNLGKGIGSNVLNNIIENRWELLAGTVAGVATKSLMLHFGMAAAVTTAVGGASLAAPLVGMAVLLGASGGAASGLARAIVRNNKHGRDFTVGNTAWKVYGQSIIKGALCGAGGGMLGSVLEHVGSGLWHEVGEWISKQHGAHHAVANTASAVAKATKPVVPSGVSPNDSAATAQAASSAAPAAGTPTAHGIGFDYKSYMTQAQFDSLDPKIQTLASSHSAHDIILFCKEASKVLDTGHLNDPSVMQNSLAMLNKGAEVAQNANITNSTSLMIDRDIAQIEFKGFGVPKNWGDALAHAKRAGNIGAKLASQIQSAMAAPAPVL